MPRQPDPLLEKRILQAAGRLRARGGEKALTMRAVAKAARTTTPTVYERYHNRADLVRALRLQTRAELFVALRESRTLEQGCQRYLEFALKHRHAYEVLYDRFAEPPSLYEPWPSFNLLRERLTRRLGGVPRHHTRLMLAIWSLIHGTAMLLIRGSVIDPLRTQMFHSCLDAVEAIVKERSRNPGRVRSGPPWPANLVLGEEAKSKVIYADGGKLARTGPRQKTTAKKSA